MAGRPTFVPRSRAAAGHESKKSLEVYQHISLEAVEQAYQDAIQSVQHLMGHPTCRKSQSCETFATFVGI